MKFSIGIPAYKTSYITICIDSILKQTYADFELIIVNDASPENIDEIVGKYSDTRIKYFKNKLNSGAENVVDNWNKCLSYASGDFFVLMGDDDKMESNYLQEFVNLIEKYPILDVYHCRSKIINEMSEVIGLTPSWPEFESLYDNIWHRTNSLRIQFISDFLFRTSTIRALGGFFKLPLAWGSDDITVYLTIGKKGIAHTNKPVFNYRKNSQTISSIGSTHFKMEAVIQERKWLSDFLIQLPANEDDRTIHRNLTAGINVYFQRKKMQTIFQSYNEGLFSQFIYWYNNRSELNIKTCELLYSVIGHFKQKTTKTLLKQ